MFAVQALNRAQAPASPRDIIRSPTEDNVIFCCGFDADTPTSDNLICKILLVESEDDPDVINFIVEQRYVGHQRYSSSLAFLPSGDCFVSGGYDGTLRCFDVASGVERWNLSTGNRAQIAFRVAVSPAGTMIAAAVRGDASSELHIYDAGTQKQLCNRTLLEKDDTFYVSFSPDGTNILCHGMHGAVVVDASTLETLFSFDPSTQFPDERCKPDVSGAAWSPCGRRVAVSSISDNLAVLEIYDISYSDAAAVLIGTVPAVKMTGGLSGSIEWRSSGIWTKGAQFFRIVVPELSRSMNEVYLPDYDGVRSELLPLPSAANEFDTCLAVGSSFSGFRAFRLVAK